MELDQCWVTKLIASQKTDAKSRMLLQKDRQNDLVKCPVEEELELNDDADKCLHGCNNCFALGPVPGGESSVLTVTLLLLLQQHNCIPGTFISFHW
jgi:hypothetical protein